MKELAGAISEGLLVGETLHRQLAAYPFYESIGFNDSTREVKGKLGKELMVYSNVCFQGFFKKLNESLLSFNHLFYHNCLFNYRCLWGNVAAYLWQYGRSFIMKRNKIRRVYIIRNVDCLIDYFRIDFTFVPNLAKHKETVDKKAMKQS